MQAVRLQHLGRGAAQGEKPSSRANQSHREDLLGCEAWHFLEASFLYLQKQPFIPTIQS